MTTDWRKVLKNRLMADQQRLREERAQAVRDDQIAETMFARAVEDISVQLDVAHAGLARNKRQVQRRQQDSQYILTLDQGTLTVSMDSATHQIRIQVSDDAPLVLEPVPTSRAWLSTDGDVVSDLTPILSRSIAQFIERAGS